MYEFLTDPDLTEEEKMILMQQARQAEQMRQPQGGGMPPGMQMTQGGGSTAGSSAASGAGGPAASSFVLPAAVLAGFAHLGEESGKGVEWANDEIMEPIYSNLLEKPVKESIRAGESILDELKFWEWF